VRSATKFHEIFIIIVFVSNMEKLWVVLFFTALIKLLETALDDPPGLLSQIS